MANADSNTEKYFTDFASLFAVRGERVNKFPIEPITAALSQANSIVTIVMSDPDMDRANSNSLWAASDILHQLQEVIDAYSESKAEDKS